MKSRSAIGFTLIELMVTITMIAIVLTVGVPSFQSSIRNSVLTAGINEFIAALNFARSEAIKRGMNVTVSKTSSTLGYEGGWQIFTDSLNSSNHYGTLEGTDQVLRTHGPINTGYTLRGNNNVVSYISYQADGTSQNYGSFALCDATQTLTTSTARVISINNLGRETSSTGNSNGILQNSSGSAFNSCASP